MNKMIAAGALFVVTVIGQGKIAPDAAVVLADMRQALGGDAVLSKVKAFAVEGSLRRNLGGRMVDSSIEMLCSLPESCLRASTQSGGPFSITVTDGFNGDDVIRSIVSPGRTPPQDISTGPNTPEAIAARRRSAAVRNKQQFTRILLALFGRSLSSYPMEFSVAGPDQFNGRDVEGLDAKAADGFTLRLLVDRETHLPAAVVWKAPVLMMRTTSQTIAVNRRSGEVREETPPVATPPPGLPPGAIAVNGTPSGNPAAGQPLVEHVIAFTEFKTAEGLTWPRRITETADGQPLEEVRLGAFRTNPVIDPRRFEPMKH